LARQTKTAEVGTKSGVEVTIDGDVALVNVWGLVDEHFAGFGDIGDAKVAILDVSGISRMTSFGVRQWLKSKDALPKTITDVYLVGCPTFFVDQLNMVLNFGGSAKVVTVVAPYTCLGCGSESAETIDVVTHRALLAKGGYPEKECPKCGGKLELDETPESYFSFVPKYAATTVHPAAAQALAMRGLYIAHDPNAEKPPKIIKLVHGSVTYFRINGTVGSMFRARPFLVGAEGEVVIDLAGVDRVDPSGLREWRRVLKSLAGQVPSVTLVDVGESVLSVAADSFTIARNISVYSVLVPYKCTECGRRSNESHVLGRAAWPIELPEQICPSCGGITRAEVPSQTLAPLEKAATRSPPASTKLIQQRDEILSRAYTDANVAQAGGGATASLNEDDTILGKYKIVRPLSSGGMAEVFLADQIGIGGFKKPVALKRIQSKLLETRQTAIDMFLNEAKIAGRLTHPNIVQVLDVGEVGGALYLAMEFVKGKDLREVCRKLRSSRITMPVGEACYIAREVAEALHHAYWSTDHAGNRLNVVHRDVSPHNIILGYDGTVKLLDFGVAMSAVTDQQHTMIVGKWLYMSPEHTMNQAIDHRSDLFSLGVVMYLLCTGRMPFSGTDPKEIVRKIRAGEHVPVQIAAPGIPEPLAELVERLLSPNPDDRPQTGRDVVDKLNQLMRSRGQSVSASNVAALVASLFPNQQNEVQIDGVQLVSVGGGSGDTPERVTPSSISSVNHGPKTSQQFRGVPDVSVSLSRAREDSQPFKTVRPPETPQPMARARLSMHHDAPTPTLQKVSTKGIVIAVLIALVAVLLYLITHQS